MIRFITHNWKTHDIHYELETEFKNDFDLVEKFNKEIKINYKLKCTQVMVGFLIFKQN